MRGWPALGIVLLDMLVVIGSSKRENGCLTTETCFIDGDAFEDECSDDGVRTWIPLLSSSFSAAVSVVGDRCDRPWAVEPRRLCLAVLDGVSVEGRVA